MPCHEIFDGQNKEYKNKILNETSIKVSIEAATEDYWRKYVGENGMIFGINDFGKSAPYQNIYDHFNLTTESIVNRIRKII